MSSNSGLTQNPVTSISTPQPRVSFKLMSDAAFTVSALSTGQTYLLPAAAAGRVITLPAAADCAGCHWKFQMTATAANTWTLTPPASTLKGSLVNSTNANGGIGLLVNVGPGAVGSATVDFTAAALSGDWIEVTSDGTSHYVNGLSRVAAGLGAA